jgi:uncharacterized membrane protein YkoI
MNKQWISLSAACALMAGAGPLDLRADEIPFSQAPAPVQRAVREHAQGETLAHIERNIRNGVTVYEAEYKREGLNRRVYFAADGKMLPDSGVAAATRDLRNALRTAPSIALSDLPSVVQKTIREQQAGREVIDVDKEMWNGKEIFEVEFREAGPNSRLHIARDGSLVVDKDRKVGIYYGTQLAEAPPAVQSTVKRVVSSAVIEDVDRETRDGRVVYDIEVKQEGLNRHLKIAEDGTLLADTNNRDGVERVRERVELSSGAESNLMTIEQVPLAVQKTIREHAVVGTLKPIKKELRNGSTLYDVEYEKEGKNLRLTIAENGAIVKDNK